MTFYLLKFSDQLWKLSGTTLMNKAHIYPPCDKWKLRNKGEKVYIENSSQNKVLSVGKDDIVNEESLIKNDSKGKQTWTKGVANNEGYFTLTNSKKVMTYDITDKCISIKGIYKSGPGGLWRFQLVDTKLAKFYYQIER